MKKIVKAKNGTTYIYTKENGCLVKERICEEWHFTEVFKENGFMSHKRECLSGELNEFRYAEHYNNIMIRIDTYDYIKRKEKLGRGGSGIYEFSQELNLNTQYMPNQDFYEEVIKALEQEKKMNEICKINEIPKQKILKF